MTANRVSPACKPAVINVGDEILFGEKRNTNQEWMLHTLWQHRQPAHAALCLPDDVETIASWIRLLRTSGHDPIMVSGGLGGTHDDCTREGVARGLGVDLALHEACFRLLQQRYGERFTPQRQRMAWLPQDCTLISNPLGAPGFSVRGVHAFPGFPTMLQPMMKAVLAEIFPEPAVAGWEIVETTLAAAEGDIAPAVEQFSRATPTARVGIYPSTQRFRRATTVRVRYAQDDDGVAQSARRLLADLEQRFAVVDTETDD